MTIDEQIAILQAAKEGEVIEWMPKIANQGSPWGTIKNDVEFNFHDFFYRIKREPRELWAAINRYGVIDYWSTDKHTLVDLTDNDPRSWEIVKFREVIE